MVGFRMGMDIQILILVVMAMDILLNMAIRGIMEAKLVVMEMDKARLIIINNNTSELLVQMAHHTYSKGWTIAPTLL